MAYFVRISVHVFKRKLRRASRLTTGITSTKYYFSFIQLFAVAMAYCAALNEKRVNGEFNIKRLVHLPVCQLLPGFVSYSEQRPDTK